MKIKVKIEYILDSLIILEILDKHSSMQNKLDAKDIIQFASKKYNRILTKERIIKCVSYLREEIGYKVFQYPDGYVKREENLDVEYFSNLASSICKTTYLKADDINSIIRKIQRLLAELEFINSEIKKIEDENLIKYNKYVKNHIEQLYLEIKNKETIILKYKTQSIKEKYRKYKVIPIKIVQNNMHYYVLAYVIEGNKYKYFRVDKIKEIIVLEENIKIEDVEIDDIFKKTKEEIIFTFNKNKLDYVVDRFGTNIEILPMSDSSYITTVYENKEIAKSSFLEILDSINILKPSNLEMELEFRIWQLEEKGDIK